MNENLFDNYVKDKLHDYESSVPQGLWEKIVADKEKKKPLPFWKNGYLQSAVIGLVVGALLTSGYWATKKNNSVADNNYKINKTNNTVTNTILKPDQPTEGISTKAVTHTSNSDDKRADEKHLISAVAKKESTIQKNSSVAIETTDNYNHYSKVEKKELANPVAVNRMGEEAPKSVNNTSTAITDKVSSLQTEEKRATQLPLSPVAKETTMANDAMDNSLTHFFVKGNIVLSESDLADSKTVNKTLQSANNTSTTIHLPNIKNKGWSVEFYASPDYDMKQVSANGVSASYLHSQDSSNKSIGGYTAGFRISKSISNNFSIKSGVQFKESTERFRYIKQNDVKNITVVSVRSYTDNSGATVYQNDTSTIQQVGGYTLRTVFNTYKSIEIPLIASWEKGNNKWHVAVNGGIILNLATYYEGQTLDNSYAIVPLSVKQSSGFFRSNANCSIYGSLSLLYNIGKGMDVFAEPYYRYALGNNSTSAIGYDQRFNSAGINCGIRYRIPTKSIK